MLFCKNSTKCCRSHAPFDETLLNFDLGLVLGRCRDVLGVSHFGQVLVLLAAPRPLLRDVLREQVVHHLRAEAGDLGRRECPASVVALLPVAIVLRSFAARLLQETFIATSSHVLMSSLFSSSVLFTRNDSSSI